MARPKSILSAQKLTLTTTEGVISRLEDLLNTGMYGRSKTEVAEELLRRALRELVNTDELEKQRRKNR